MACEGRRGGLLASRRRGYREVGRGGYLFQLGFFGLLIFAGFGGLSIQLSRRELFGFYQLSFILQQTKSLAALGYGECEYTFRLKRAFSRPDILSSYGGESGSVNVMLRVWLYRPVDVMIL